MFKIINTFSDFHLDCSIVKEGLSFALDLSLENSADSYLRFNKALLHPVF